MPATLALKHAALDLVVGYAGLISAVSSIPNGSVTEVAPASYARQAVTWGANAAGAKENSNLMTFPATSGSATYRYVGVWSASTGGTLWFVWDLGEDFDYDASHQPVIPIGALDLDANRTTT